MTVLLIKLSVIEHWYTKQEKVITFMLHTGKKGFQKIFEIICAKIIVFDKSEILRRKRFDLQNR